MRIHLSGIDTQQLQRKFPDSKCVGFSRCYYPRGERAGFYYTLMTVDVPDGTKVENFYPELNLREEARPYLSVCVGARCQHPHCLGIRPRDAY